MMADGMEDDVPLSLSIDVDREELKPSLFLSQNLGVVLVLPKVLGSALGDSNGDCLTALQRCYDYSVFAMRQKLDVPNLAVLGDGCMLYASAIQCMETLQCARTPEFTLKMKELKKNLYNDTKGLCTTQGKLDDCFYMLLSCERVFELADEDLKKQNSSAACLEVAAFERCISPTKERCPGIAVKDVYAKWEPLNKDAYNAGCYVDCNKALQQCTYELDVSDPLDRNEYCTALSNTQKCLEKTQKDVDCSSEKSQQYLETAKKQKGSKYSSQCGNGVPAIAQICTQMFLMTILVSLLSRRFFH
ncbi:hypothetical protein EGW08_019119 [Elysia chlorotica]|uniref:Uncharacterized protein n=1 Tax=Elysia chlorotica TaxID=188477 RepID=A0A3S1BRF9_ELYCH|nr:hypothetical protein EGW08_019119 [Elysia chlorotica]